MLQEKDNSNQRLNGSVLTVQHNLDFFPSDYSAYQFSKNERQEILDAVTKIATDHRSYYIHTSPLQKEAEALLGDQESINAMISIICNARDFFVELDVNKNVDNRIKLTNKLLSNFEIIEKKQGDKAWHELLEKIYQSSKIPVWLKIVPLILVEMQNHLVVIRHFMLSELIGHGVAYDIANNPNKIDKVILKSKVSATSETFSVREIIVKFEAHEDKKQRDASLIATVLTPVYQSKDIIPEKPTIYIAWTGTYDQTTLKADFERNAGEESFRNAQAQIMQQILQALSIFKSYCNKPMRIVVTGHSLGGALSQLLFHSLQRHLAVALEKKYPELVGADEKFIQALHQSIPCYKTNPKIGQLVSNTSIMLSDISELNLSIWNSTGVLQAVEEHSNYLSQLFEDKALLQQSAYIGCVGGDVIQMTGQGTIMSHVAKNKNAAHIHVLKIEPNTVRATGTLSGLVGGGFFGSLFFSSFFAVNPLFGAMLGLGIATSAILKKSYDAHTIKHFSTDYQSMREIFNIRYRLFGTHLPDGSLNDSQTSGYPKVIEQLKRKSSIIESATSIMSNAKFFGNKNAKDSVKPFKAPSDLNNNNDSFNLSPFQQ